MRNLTQIGGQILHLRAQRERSHRNAALALIRGDRRRLRYWSRAGARVSDRIDRHFDRLISGHLDEQMPFVA